MMASINLTFHGAWSAEDGDLKRITDKVWSLQSKIPTLKGEIRTLKAEIWTW